MDELKFLAAINIFIGLIAICQRQVTIFFLRKGKKDEKRIK